ncbi:uncharacterized protein [Primulina huaijiensis]|uniref:uncharacterized protein n=1 Tax=Primulina huaijiensis TaxID=1492673 RepID=UPI003CC7040F
MENGDNHIDKKRKIDAVSPEEDNDDQLNLTLSLKPFVPRTPQPSPTLPPPPTSVPVYGLFSTSAIVNSPRISPRPPRQLPPTPPRIPVYLQFFPIPTPLASPTHSPQPPPPLTEVYGNLYPNETLNYTILSPPPPSCPSSPVYRQFPPTATLNSSILPPQPSPPPPSIFQEPSCNGDGHPWPPRSRRNPTQLPRGGKSLEIAPPYSWATNLRATVHSLQHLLSIHIHTIIGDVQCKICGRNYEMGFDLRQKSLEIFQFIIENKGQMQDRAPSAWLIPSLPPCRLCGEKNSVKPIISDKKKTVNWLFLLLGQMLGFCSLAQLKYFCKHTNNHHTGAKDRLLYLTYVQLCKQLDPNGPVDR